MAHLPGDYRKSGRSLWRIVWVVMANRAGGYGEGGGGTIPPLCKGLIYKEIGKAKTRKTAISGVNTINYTLGSSES